MVVEVRVGLLACRRAVCATMSYQAWGKRKKRIKCSENPWGKQKLPVSLMTDCNCHLGPLLGAKWPWKCTPQSHRVGAEKLRSAVLTWPFPCVAGGIWHLISFEPSRSPFWEVALSLANTGQYGTKVSGRLWAVEVNGRAGAQMEVEEQPALRWSALNVRFLELALQCLLSLHDLPLPFFSGLI